MIKDTYCYKETNQTKQISENVFKGCYTLQMEPCIIPLPLAVDYKSLMDPYIKITQSTSPFTV